MTDDSTSKVTSATLIGRREPSLEDRSNQVCRSLDRLVASVVFAVRLILQLLWVVFLWLYDTSFDRYRYCLEKSNT